jgi:hypothetical protein
LYSEKCLALNQLSDHSRLAKGVRIGEAQIGRQAFSFCTDKISGQSKKGSSISTQLIPYTDGAGKRIFIVAY